MRGEQRKTILLVEDGILMDIDLGKGINGADAAIVILREREIPIVFLSNHTEPEVVGKTEKITSYGYVVKNSGITVLDASIKMAFKLFNSNKTVVESERELRKSHQLLKSTFSSLTDAIFILDAKTVVLDCNTAATQIFGYGREEMLDRTTEFLHVNHETLEEFRRHLASSIAEKGCLYLPEFKMKRKDGTVFPTEHSVMPLEDKQGGRIGWVSVVRNITERKQAEKALYESKELYRKLTETTLMGVWQVRIDGSTVYANPAMKYLLEVDDEDVFATRHYYSFFSDESIEMMNEEQSKRSQGISSVYEAELIGVRGKRRNVIIAGAPVFSIDGELAGLIGSFIDIADLPLPKNTQTEL
jgi:PAS domain S-box-containing protein